MKNYKIQKFPNSRIASIDICEVGKQKHHVAGLVEFDVTDSRKKIREYNKAHRNKISFHAWLISAIAFTLKKHETSCSYLYRKNKLLIFNDINVSLIVEKDMDGTKVPIPLVIEKANEKSIESITMQIAEAKNIVFLFSSLFLDCFISI
jgi:pyruvate/2-oxoglutarate dehydrogenase complex dihydrolipoamide acyltransferase (E2) component